MARTLTLWCDGELLVDDMSVNLTSTIDIILCLVVIRLARNVLALAASQMSTLLLKSKSQLVTAAILIQPI
jgi:hypothetical protein